MPPGGTHELANREKAIALMVEWGVNFDPSMSNEDIEDALYENQPSSDCAQCNFMIKDSPDSKITTLRGIKEWTDCDFVEYDFMVMLGLIDPVKSPFASKAKHVFWSANEVGTAVHEMVETFVRLGMLEKRDEPDLQYRWNQEFKGSWE